MSRLTHGFRIDAQRCQGCLACMRICPTRAIRVRQGYAQYGPDQCIDCGACLTACGHGAIAAETLSVDDLSRFKFKVAVPSPVLFGQFPAGVTAAQIAEGLLALGFDAVWDYSAEIGLASRGIFEYVRNWKGTTPLISIACPVVVRLIQVSYPRMVDQLIPLQPPREIAGREVKRRYARALGLSEDEVGAIYITPCQAKTISILQPAEGAMSHLDGALGISDLYNSILAYASLKRDKGAHPETSSYRIRNSMYLRWPISEGLSRSLSRHRYLSVTGLTNIIQVFDDIAKGKLRNVDFLEAYNCWSGCTGGNLTVGNVYVTLRKMRSMIDEIPDMDPETEAEVERRFAGEDLALERPIRPRAVRSTAGSLKERLERIRMSEAIQQSLPGLDCGLCGAPTCKELARDVSMGDAVASDCLFHSKDRLQQLRRTYLHEPE